MDLDNVHSGLVGPGSSGTKVMDNLLNLTDRELARSDPVVTPLEGFSSTGTDNVVAPVLRLGDFGIRRTCRCLQR